MFIRAIKDLKGVRMSKIDLKSLFFIIGVEMSRQKIYQLSTTELLTLVKMIRNAGGIIQTTDHLSEELNKLVDKLDSAYVAREEEQP